MQHHIQACWETAEMYEDYVPCSLFISGKKFLVKLLGYRDRPIKSTVIGQGCKTC